ncbi:MULTISPECIES: hypothetical protein, partial [unclassified Acinetobacter]|uniref:hypothetical protein n=1 Tax=unclassified Acinetobacter TaxID=196816 RepID=UPI0025764183
HVRVSHRQLLNLKAPSKRRGFFYGGKKDSFSLTYIKIISHLHDTLIFLNIKVLSNFIFDYN